MSDRITPSHGEVLGYLGDKVELVGMGAVGLVLLGMVAGCGVGVGELFAQGQNNGDTSGNIMLHGRPCEGYGTVVEELGSGVVAQAYVDEHQGAAYGVCFEGETKEGATWFTTGRVS